MSDRRLLKESDIELTAIRENARMSSPDLLQIRDMQAFVERGLANRKRWRDKEPSSIKTLMRKG